MSRKKYVGNPPVPVDNPSFGWLGDGSMDLVLIEATAPDGSVAIDYSGFVVCGPDGVSSLLKAIASAVGVTGKTELFRSLDFEASFAISQGSMNFDEWGFRPGRVFHAYFPCVPDDAENCGRVERDFLKSLAGSGRIFWGFGHEGLPPDDDDGTGWGAASRGVCMEEALRLGLASPDALAARETTERWPSTLLFEWLVGRGADPSAALLRLLSSSTPPIGHGEGAGSWLADHFDHSEERESQASVVGSLVHLVLECGASAAPLFADRASRSSWFAENGTRLECDDREALLARFASEEASECLASTPENLPRFGPRRKL